MKKIAFKEGETLVMCKPFCRHLITQPPVVGFLGGIFRISKLSGSRFWVQGSGLNAQLAG